MNAMHIHKCIMRCAIHKQLFDHELRVISISFVYCIAHVTFRRYMCIVVFKLNAHKRNDVITMFNNYARLSSTRFTFLNNVNAHEFAIVELMIEQQFATSFDDIYTMHIYRDNAHNYKYVVDVAFELHTNTFYVDEYDNATYENIHSYDMRVNVDVSSNEIDYDEICNTIENVKFDVVHCNAYTSINYVHS